MARKNIKKIKYRAPYEIPCISDYNSTSVMFIRRIEIQLKYKNSELKRIGVNSDNRKNYLENIIETEFAVISRKYEQIHHNDRMQIRKAIERRKSDRIEFSNLLEMLDVEIQSLATEYSMLEELYKKYNPLHNGRLDTEGVSFTNATTENTKEGDNDNE